MLEMPFKHLRCRAEITHERQYDHVVTDLPHVTSRKVVKPGSFGNRVRMLLVTALP